MSSQDASSENRLRINLEVIEQSKTMQNINKYSVLNDTKAFNDSKIQDENSRIILVQLIYLVNQGQSFTELDLELLFFRVTKLLLSNNSRLKRVIYKFLKMIGVQKYVHILIQSLINDLTSPNPLIRIEALRFISTIQEEIYIQQIERFVHKALLDNNFQVFNSALIVGINIYCKFPHIVNKWSQEIYLKLYQQNNVNYYALVLLHEINKNNKQLFVDTLISPQVFQQQLASLQILKFINEFSYNQNVNKDLKPFLQLIFHQDSIIFLESIQILMQNMEVLNISLEPIIARLKNILSSQTNNIEIYSTLKKIEYLIKIFGKSYSEITQLMYQVENLTYFEKISISCRSLLVCINQQTNNIENYLQCLFNQTQLNACKFNFLEGLNEVIEINPQFGQLVLNTLQLIIYEDSNIVQKLMTIQIIYLILNRSKKHFLTALLILFRLSSPMEFTLQFFIIQTISWNFFLIEIKELEKQNIFLCFSYLKFEFQKGYEDFINVSSNRYQLIKSQLLQIIQADQTQLKLIEQLLDKFISQDIYYDRAEFDVQDVSQDQSIILTNSQRQEQYLLTKGHYLS